MIRVEYWSKERGKGESGGLVHTLLYVLKYSGKYN